MQPIHFPACGFGFWYLLGIYVKNKKRINKRIVSGSSAGTLICVLSLTKHADLYDKIMGFVRLYKENGNLHDTFVYTADSILSLVEDTERTKRKLKRIRIVVTRIQSSFPFIEREVVTPDSLSELRELCIASAYIPFVSNYQNKLYYSIDNACYIDGIFTELHTTHDIQIPSEFYGVTPPSEDKCKLMYNKGLQFLISS